MFLDVILPDIFNLDVFSFFPVRIGQAACSRSGDSTKRLIKYSIFAWTTPAAIVIISVTLDKTNALFIGYGKFY